MYQYSCAFDPDIEKDYPIEDLTMPWECRKPTVEDMELLHNELGYPYVRLNRMVNFVGKETAYLFRRAGGTLRPAVIVPAKIVDSREVRLLNVRVLEDVTATELSEVFRILADAATPPLLLTLDPTKLYANEDYEILSVVRQYATRDPDGFLYRFRNSDGGPKGGQPAPTEPGPHAPLDPLQGGPVERISDPRPSPALERAPKGSGKG